MNKKQIKMCTDIALSEFYKLKELNNESSYLHWSFIFQKGELIEWATNRKADTFIKLGYKPGRRYDHAEPRCFRKSVGRMDIRRPWDIFNIRLTRLQTSAMARPCPICYGFLCAVGCSSVYYTDGTGVSKLIL